MQVTCLAVLFSACLGAPFDPKFCAPPTYEQCIADPDSGTPCDRYFREQARTDPDAGCSILYEQAANSLTEQYPPTPRLQPSWYATASGKYVATDGGAHLASPVPADRDAFNVTGLDTMYLGSVQRYTAELPKTRASPLHIMPVPDVGAVAAQAKFVADRAAWEANNNHVMSCDEYVHEKYFDYSQFEDALAYVGLADHREIYNAAYIPGYLDTPASAALGYNKMIDPVLRGRDGTPFAQKFPFERNIPKNDFFLVPPPVATKVLIVSTPNGVDSFGVARGTSTVIVSLAKMHRKKLNLAGVEFDDQTLVPLIDAGRERYQQTFAWHQKMSERNAAVLDEVLYSWDEQQTEFKALLATRAAIVDQIGAALGGMSGGAITTGMNYGEAWWANPYWNPDPTAVDLAAQLDGFNVKIDTTFQNPGAATPGPPPADPPGPPVTAKLPSYAKVTTADQVVKSCTGAPVICLFYSLEATDDLIETFLENVRTVCLQEHPGAPEPCDWSPKKFSSAVLDQFVSVREAQYQLCQYYTYDDFSSLTNKSFCFPSGDCSSIDIGPTDYTKNPTKLETYFVAREAYLDAIRSYLGDIYNPSPPPTFLVQRDAADEWEGGDPDTIQGHADYEVKFEVGDFDNSNHCAITESMTGGIHAWVRALGSGKYELVDGSITVTDTKTDAHLSVLDNAYVLVDIDNKQHSDAYSLVEGNKEKSKTFVDVSTTFVIVVVPVTLGARVSGTVGTDYAITAVKTTDTTGNCEIKNAGVTGQITPFARIDGEIYAAVDAFVVSAGIKGTVTIASVSVPITADISIAPDSMDSTISNITLDSDASIDFTFLSGKISAYVTVGPCPFCAEYDKDLIAWDGIPYEVPLFHTQTVIPLQDLRALAESPPMVEK